MSSYLCSPGPCNSFTVAMPMENRFIVVIWYAKRYWLEGRSEVFCRWVLTILFVGLSWLVSIFVEAVRHHYHGSRGTIFFPNTHDLKFPVALNRLHFCDYFAFLIWMLDKNVVDYNGCSQTRQKCLCFDLIISACGIRCLISLLMDTQTISWIADSWTLCIHIF